MVAPFAYSPRAARRRRSRCADVPREASCVPRHPRPRATWARGLLDFSRVAHFLDAIDPREAHHVEEMHFLPGSTDVARADRVQYGSGRRAGHFERRTLNFQRSAGAQALLM